MNKKMNLQLVVCLTIFVFSLILPTHAQAQAVTTPLLKQAVTYNFEGETIYGNTPVVQVFNLAEPTSVSDFHLQLKLIASPTILTDRAFVTVRFNNQVLLSQQVNTSGETVIDLKIPAKYAQTTNTLVIEGVLKSTELMCELTDEVNWLVAQAGSQLTFTQESQPQISQWFSQMQDEQQTFHFATPDTMTAFNYEQLANLTAVVSQAQQKAGQVANIEVVSRSEMDIKTNYILIGTRAQIEQMASNGISQVEQDKTLAETGGIMYVLIENQWHLALVTETEEQLRTLIDTLEFSDLYKQISGSRYALQSVEPRENLQLNQTAILSEQGFANARVSGQGDQLINFFISTPLRQEVSTAEFTFAYRASEQLDRQQSFVELSVNGSVVRTVPLISSEDLQEINIELSHSLAQQGAWNVQLRFHLERLNPSCATLIQDDLWAEIDASASFYQYESQLREQFNIASSPGILQNEIGETFGEVQLNPEVISSQQFVDLMTALTRVSRGIDYLFVQTEVTEYLTDGVVIDSPLSEGMQKLSQQTHFPLDENGKVIGQAEFVQIATMLSQIQFLKAMPMMVIGSHTIEQTGLVLEQLTKQTLVQDAESILFEAAEPVKFVQAQTITGERVRQALDWNIIVPVFSTVAVVVTGGVVFFMRMRHQQDQK
ncbi:MAG: cellulose biosynthesis cyclic di-GMP-binding regulatory protein BcsB [Culicoidibacterales bacterium]